MFSFLNTSITHIMIYSQKKLNFLLFGQKKMELFQES